jgi:type II secretory pathway pseudopilin PulG
MARTPTVRTAARRAFTLAELVVAGLIAAIVVGAVGASLSQLARTRTVARVRLDSHLRTSMALDRIRREVQAAIRSDDLFDSRLMIVDDTVSAPVGDLDRDELLVFNTKVRPVRERTYSGDGQEWETHLRVEEDEIGAALWMRTDAVPDDVDRGGGMAEPIMSGIIGVKFEAYDGTMWRDEWDSDIDGMPWAVRVTISGTGRPDGEDPFEDPRDLLSLSTVIPLDRVMPPYVPVDPSAQPSDGGTGAGGIAGAGGGGGGGAGADGASADAATIGPPGGVGGAPGADGFTGGRGFGSAGGRGGAVGGRGGAVGGRGGAGVMSGSRGGGRP